MSCLAMGVQFGPLHPVEAAPVSDGSGVALDDEESAELSFGRLFVVTPTSLHSLVADADAVVLDGNGALGPVPTPPALAGDSLERHLCLVAESGEEEPDVPLGAHSHHPTTYAQVQWHAYPRLHAHAAMSALS